MRMQPHYDYLIVGAGITSAVLVHEAKEAGRSCLVIDRCSHVADNGFGRMTAFRKGATSRYYAWFGASYKDFARLCGVFVSFTDIDRFIQASLLNESDSLQNSSMLSIFALMGGARCSDFVVGFGRLMRERSACSFRNALLQPRGLSVLRIFLRLAWQGSS